MNKDYRFGGYLVFFSVMEEDGQFEGLPQGWEARPLEGVKAGNGFFHPRRANKNNHATETGTTTSGSSSAQIRKPHRPTSKRVG